MRTLLIIVSILSATTAHATDVRMFGPFAATPNFSGTAVRLTVGEIANFDRYFYSGTLRLEYWFFPFPFTGQYQSGWRSSIATLGQLAPLYSFVNVDQTVAFSVPPNGYWCPSLQVTEYNGVSYPAVDWVNFDCRYIGPPPNVPPVAVIASVPHPISGVEPLDVYVDAFDSYDSDGFIVEYLWLLSDGSSALGPEQSFTLPAGDYTLSLAVEDNDGSIDTTTISISVDPAPPPASFDRCGFGLYRDVGGLNKFFLDSDRDGRTDLSFVFGPSDAEVYVTERNDGDFVAIRRAVAGGALSKFFADFDRDAQSEASFVMGTPADQLLLGDFSGTGSHLAGLKRNVGGVGKFFLDTNGDTRPNDVVKSFNGFVDETVIGDWDGVGRDNIGTIKNVSGGLKWILETDSGAVVRTNFGRVATDRALTGDFDADGRDDLVLVRSLANGLAKWIVDLNQDGVPDEQFNFGRATDLPVVCDWDGDGDDDPGYVRRESGRMTFTTNPQHLPGGAGGVTVRFGNETDTPIVGVWE